MKPGHHTASGTRKYQCQGPLSWSTGLQKIAGKDRPEGEGIRAAIAYAVSHMAELEEFVAGNRVLSSGQLEARRFSRAPGRAGDPNAAPMSAPPDDDTLRAWVKDVLPKVQGEGMRFGPQKVFVSALWEQIETEHGVDDGAPPLRDFKTWLLKANREGWYILARADLVAAMDPDVVRRSTIEDQGASFHFVLDPSAKEPWEREDARPAGVQRAEQIAHEVKAKANPCGVRRKGGDPCTKAKGHNGWHENSRSKWTGTGQDAARFEPAKKPRSTTKAARRGAKRRGK